MPHTGKVDFMIELDLNTNDAETLLRHCESYVSTPVEN